MPCLHAVIATLSGTGTSVTACMSMLMHPIENLGQHASSAVSIMLTNLMVTVGWNGSRPVNVRDIAMKH